MHQINICMRLFGRINNHANIIAFEMPEIICEVRKPPKATSKLPSNACLLKDTLIAKYPTSIRILLQGFTVGEQMAHNPKSTTKVTPFNRIPLLPGLYLEQQVLAEDADTHAKHNLHQWV
ncbi:unnamed protein product [Hermetia illucens]|uniref:Uncharacterized protein n=1 Tax=Hermetia illucens TaxID=343691 RepID=A0A7R8YVP6_HERIL|nr:unnamed protein product [Hermetia illucens]